MLNRNKDKSILVLGLLAMILLVLSGCGGRKVAFERPDIKDDFCGIVMNYQYCKCAFHNEFCDAVGLSPSTANWYVRSEYNRWLSFLFDRFQDDCRGGGGKMLSKKACTYCDPPNEWSGDDCVPAEEAEEEDDENKGGFVAEGPVNNDCSINEAKFEEEWKKYSDLEGPIDFNSRSWESQQALSTYDRIMELKIQNFELERDMELDRQIRLELRDYREKLVRNQKQNLIKALIRLSYVTYTTIEAGKGAAGSFGTFLNGTNVIARTGGLLSTVKTYVPKGSSLAIDTSTTGGKAVNVGLSTAIEALEKLGDPKDVAVKFMTETRNAALPSADISPEEIEILRTQHLQKQGIDAVLAQSYLINSQRRSVLEGNINEIEQLEAQLAAWEGKEKARVKGLLEYQCEQAKKRYEEE